MKCRSMSASLPKFKGYQHHTFQPLGQPFEGSPTTQPSTVLVEETPLAISINDITYAVVMVTPVDLASFAIGFCLSEGIINQLSDVRDIQIHHSTIQLDIDSIVINLDVSPRQFAQFKKKRAHLSASGCGLCGTESLEQAIPVLPELPPSQSIPLHTLISLRERLTEHQILGKKTGAIHAALLLSPNNEPLCCMEDIGRHNALDKIIGFAQQHAINLHNHNVVMSSRCSTELVQKAVRAGLSNLTHLASPS
ncbi:formate dehydrogenase accessory sulfurtransferase FdhD, partial [Marinomonas sp.]